MSSDQSHVLADYESVLSDLDHLVQGDYRSRANKICDTMSRLATDGLIIKAMVLEHALHKQDLVLTGAQSFTLRANDLYALRINCWYPKLKQSPGGNSEHEKYFSIGVCHNHNFDFFTTCVIGPGYHSDFLETEQDLSDLSEGDRVSFSRTWSLSLGLGNSLFVPRDRHFHTQYYPAEFSATINLIPIAGQSESGRQYTMEDDRETVKRVIVVG